MADFVFNLSKGRVAEFFNRVDSNDPANSAIIVVPVDRGAATDATLKDHDTLAALLAWDEPEFLRRTEGSAIRRIGHERWLRNLAVALGNAAVARSRLPSPAPNR